MQVVSTIGEVRAARAGLGRLGFVPTMGYLHAGHLSLVQEALADCGAAAASIFVNPTQFGPNEDLANYPRNLERDLTLLEAAGCALVWTPPAAEIYPPGFNTYVTVEGITALLEGERRPGHFRGVATVVAKLFNGIQPDRAYFGQKDVQQTIVIRQMVRDLAMPVEIVVSPTIREPDGLALSSRNAYLTPEQRSAAPVLYRALSAAAASFTAGERAAATLRQIMLDTLSAEPRAQVDYVSVAHPASLQELEQVDEVGAVLSMAAWLGSTRLIDNLVLGENEG